jgi:hypothetical protein
MKRKNQLTEDCPNIKKVRFNRKRCADEYLFYEGQGGASDEDECEYDRKKKLKIGLIYTLQRTITKAGKNKNNIPSYIN